MVCCLTAPSHYLNQVSLSIIVIIWHSFLGNVFLNTNDINPKVVFEIYTFGIRATGDNELTHWGRVTHICVSTLTIIGSDNVLLPGRSQAIIWTNAVTLLIRTLGTNFCEILGKIHSFSFKKMHLKMSSAKGRIFSLGLNELTVTVSSMYWVPSYCPFNDLQHLHSIVLCSGIHHSSFWLNHGIMLSRTITDQVQWCQDPYHLIFVRDWLTHYMIHFCLGNIRKHLYIQSFFDMAQVAEIFPCEKHDLSSIHTQCDGPCLCHWDSCKGGIAQNLPGLSTSARTEKMLCSIQFICHVVGCVTWLPYWDFQSGPCSFCCVFQFHRRFVTL